MSSALKSASALTTPASATSVASAGPNAPPVARTICGQPPSVHVVQSPAASVASSGTRYPTVTSGSAIASARG